MTPKNCVCDNISWEIKGNYAREIRLQPSARYNQWFDTVSTNLGTSLGFDHNNEKSAFPHSRPIYSLENYFIGRRCHLAWRVLTLADKNHRGEPHEICAKCFLKKLCLPLICTQKIKANSERYFKIFHSLVNLWTVLRSKLKQPAYRSNEFQFFQQGVCKFIFPSKFKRGSMFCDSRR